MKVVNCLLFASCIALAGCDGLSLSSNELNSDDIEQAEKGIADEYRSRIPGGKNNDRVKIDVNLNKTDPQKGEGFAKIIYPGLFGQPIEENHNCTISKDRNDGELIWKCDE